MEPVFRSTEQAVNVLFSMTARMGALVAWLFIGLLHLLVLQLLVIGLWASGSTPMTLWAAFLAGLQTNAAAVLGAIGLSVFGLVAGYWRLTKWVHRTAGSGLLLDYLTKTVRQN